MLPYETTFAYVLSGGRLVAYQCMCELSNIGVKRVFERDEFQFFLFLLFRKSVENNLRNFVDLFLKCVYFWEGCHHQLKSTYNGPTIK